MKIATASLVVLASTAAAFAPTEKGARASTSVKSGMDDLKTIAEKSNPVLKYFDPLGFAGVNIWGNSDDASIAFLRHSEIKHGRIAMFAFVGYIAHANGLRFPWPMTIEGTPFPSGGSPPELWDALPDAAKWQIILFIGFLEMFSEMAGTHYMRGGQPGKFPAFSDYPDLVPHPALSLYDPFGFSKNKSAAAKERGLISELNNGRLAQIGILGFLAEQKVPGSVPLLSQLGDFPYYDGEPMAPF